MSVGEIVRFFGACALLLSSLAVIRSYKAYIARRGREIDALCRVIDRIYDMVDLFLSPVKRIFSGFDCEDENTNELIRDIESGATPEAAYAKIEGRLAVGKEGKEILKRLFSDLGKGYKEGALSLVEGCRRRFSEYRDTSLAEDERSVKVVSALIVGCCLGVILLFF